MPWGFWGKPAPSPEDKPIWSSYELAEYLDQHPTTVIRWCRKWFGPLEHGRHAGRGRGYQIPWQYLYVGRAYLLTTSDPLREAIRPVLLANPKDWVTVVDGIPETCYSASEAVEKASKAQYVAHLLYVGEFRERLNNGKRPKS